MTTEPSALPLAAVLLPVLTSLLIVAARRAPRLREAVLVGGAVVTFGTVASMLPTVLAGGQPTTDLGELIPGFGMALRADGMGMVFASLAAVLWALASIYTIGYLRGDRASHQTRFSAFYALALGATFGVAFAADLLTFFLAFELLTVSTYPLVTHKGDAAAIGAGRRYLGYLLPGGMALLLATAIVASATDDLTFVPGGFVADALSPRTGAVVLGLVILGVGTKGGLMPLHRWLPAAMVAPTPVSALLHAVAVVKAGVFGVGRFTGFVLGPDLLATIAMTDVLAVLAATTIVVASIVALRQDHLKRRLAYSTIAHLAYIVLGFALLTPDAYDGALLHIVNHGALKITLFFCAGALYIAAREDRVSGLDGIGRAMPVTMTAFAVASLGLAGLPPMGGFLSKWYLVQGAVAGERYVYAAVIVFSGLFTAAYLFPIVVRAFFRPPPTPATHGEASPLMVGPLVATATLALLLGLGDLFRVYELTSGVAAAVTGGAP